MMLSQSSPIRRRWLAVSVLAVSAIVLSAPYIGEIRAAVSRVLPGQYTAVINGTVAASMLVVLLMTVLRIRSRRLPRYAALAAALGLGGLYALSTSTGNASVDAVERFHFIEYGLLTLLFYRVWQPAGDATIFILPALAAGLAGICDEWLQWFVPSRVGEVRDVLLNGAAISCGLLVSAAFEPPATFSWRPRPGSATRTGGLAAVVVLTFGLFLQVVHLGHLIETPGIGTFRSRYAPSRLLSLGSERAERWRTDPPGTQALLSREDKYLAEAIRHVQHRNESDAFVAWRENRILEEFYAPVLALPAGYRWPAEQRANLANEVAAGAIDTRPYDSDALPFTIFTWPSSRLWGVIVTLAIGIGAGGLLWESRLARMTVQKKGS